MILTVSSIMNVTDSSDGAEKFERLTDLHTAAEVQTFVDEQNFKWKRVGQQNNTGTAEMVRHPRNALIERVTNMLDAIIEQKIIEEYDSSEDARQELPNNPREAVSELLDLPADGFDGVDDQKVSDLAENALVRVFEGSETDQITLDLEDKGIGQKPADFPDTLLSLHGDNKNSKPYLIGRFGQGGSNSFPLSEYTIIISRSHEGGDIGWTIVRENADHETPEGDIVRAYEYAVTPGGSIPRLSETVAPRLSDGGTMIRLVDYYAEGFTGRADDKLKRTTVSGVIKHLLFASVYPVRVEDHRYDGNPAATVKGGRHLLNKSVYVDEHDNQRTQGTLDVETEYGNIELRWWAIDPDQSGQDDRKRDIVKRFVDPSNPLVWTLSGQVHHEESKAPLEQTESGMGYLKDRIIVEVNVDSIDERHRSKVFSSTRDSAMKSEVYDHIFECLVQRFEGDYQLEELNDHYHEKARSGGNTSEEANDDLSDLMSTFDIEADDVPGLDVPGSTGLATDGNGAGGGGSDGSPGVGRDPYVPEPVDNRQNEPTWMEIANPEAKNGDPVPVRQGGSFSLHLRLNAVDQFDERDDVEFRATVAGKTDAFLERSARRRLQNGHTYLVFDVDDQVDVGSAGTVTVQLTWDNEKKTDSTAIEIEPPIEQEPGNEEKTGSVAPEIIPQEDVDNTPFNFGRESVVKYVENGDDEQDEVHVALFNENIKPILNNVTRSERTLNRYTREYMAHIAFEATMEHHDDEIEMPDEEVQHRYHTRSAITLMQAIAKNVDPEDLTG